MTPRRDASQASIRLTRRGGPDGHLLSTFNKKDNDKTPDPIKREPEPVPEPERERQLSTDAEPMSTPDAESSDSDTPQRPRREETQALGEKLAAATGYSSPAYTLNTRSSTSRNTRNPLKRASSNFMDDEDDPWSLTSSQKTRKRSNQATFAKSKPPSFSSGPNSSARSPATARSKTSSAKSAKGSKKGDSSSDSVSEFRVPLHIDAPSPRKPKRDPTPQFKMPPDFQASSFPTSSIDIQGLSSDSDLTPLSSPSASIAEEMREHGFESKDKRSPSPPRKALCPMCKDEVDPELLKQFQAQPKQRLREQQQFCTSHKREAATKEWEVQGYPEINWDIFEKRLVGYYSNLERLLDLSGQSYYRNILDSAYKAGKSLRLTIEGDGIETISCGYYGTKGSQKMLFAVMERFAVRLRRLANEDSLVAKVGIAGYAQSVLVPELATLLIKEDMGVDTSVAREIMRDSIEIGLRLNPQADDIVHVDEDLEEVSE
ncbi:hypothetical protein N7520_011662 [Penicillium odoratum]|uniref:uncharacterized protein n=1 Tax=Penicillium odoratum TaxID=1167516 RepID=UPI00254839C5|nr:uncharacterized protein N7520_011662 [Penicillium odoratum]KAJ5746480.1 hypothetical protein N7520_011662 [Penicillium odoratum]